MYFFFYLLETIPDVATLGSTVLRLHLLCSACDGLVTESALPALWPVRLPTAPPIAASPFLARQR